MVKSTLAILVVLIVVPGCIPNQQPQAQRLLGKWEVMTEQKIKQHEQLANDSLATRAARESTSIDRTVSSDNLMTVEFKSGAQLETRAMQVKQGTWYFRGFSEADQTVTLECQVGREDPVIVKVRFITDDVIHMIPPNITVLEKELLFHRLH